MRRVFGVIVLMLLLAVAVPAPADGRRAPKKARTEQKKSTSRRSSGDVRKERRRTAGECPTDQFSPALQYLLSGCERDRKMPPVDKVPAHRMPPVHIRPFLPVGILLVKHMIISLKPA